MLIIDKKFSCYDGYELSVNIYNIVLISLFKENMEKINF